MINGAFDDSSCYHIPMARNSERDFPLTLQARHADGVTTIQILGDFSFRNLVGHDSHIRYLRLVGMSDCGANRLADSLESQWQIEQQELCKPEASLTQRAKNTASSIIHLFHA